MFVAHSQRRQLFTTSHPAGLRHRRRRAHPLPRRCRLSPELESGDVDDSCLQHVRGDCCTTNTGQLIVVDLYSGRVQNALLVYRDAFFCHGVTTTT